MLGLGCHAKAAASLQLNDAGLKFLEAQRGSAFGRDLDAQTPWTVVALALASTLAYIAYIAYISYTLDIIRNHHNT